MKWVENNMSKNIIKKMIIVSIITLFIGTSFIPTLSAKTETALHPQKETTINTTDQSSKQLTDLSPEDNGDQKLSSPPESDRGEGPSTPHFILDKTVWNPDTQEWTDNYDITKIRNLQDTIKFKISIKNIGIAPYDCTYTSANIHFTDTINAGETTASADISWSGHQVTVKDTLFLNVLPPLTFNIGSASCKVTYNPEVSEEKITLLTNQPQIDSGQFRDGTSCEYPPIDIHWDFQIGDSFQPDSIIDIIYDINPNPNQELDYFVDISDIHFGTGLTQVWPPTTGDGAPNWYKFINGQLIPWDINHLPKFIIVSGDMLDCGAGLYGTILYNSFYNQGVGPLEKFSQGEWRLNIETTQGETVQIPIIFAPGNHDAVIMYPFGLIMGSDNFQNFRDYVNPSPDKMYSVGNVRIFTMNSGFDVLHNDQTYGPITSLPEGDGFTTSQIQWLNTTLDSLDGYIDNQDTSGYIKIVTMHHPFFNINGEGSVLDGTFLNNRYPFITTCQNYGVNVICWGHTHMANHGHLTGGAIYIDGGSLRDDDKTHHPDITRVFYNPNCNTFLPGTPDLPTTSPLSLYMKTEGRVRADAYDEGENHTGLNPAGATDTNIPESQCSVYSYVNTLGVNKTISELTLKKNVTKNYRYVITGLAVDTVNVSFNVDFPDNQHITVWYTDVSMYQNSVAILYINHSVTDYILRIHDPDGSIREIVPSVWNDTLPKSSNYITQVYTNKDLLVFGYEDNTSIKISDSSGRKIWSGILNDGNHYYRDVPIGTYTLSGDKKFAVLTGDPVTRGVTGFYALDNNSRGAGTKFYTYMPLRYDGNERFIVFAYTDGTTGTVTNTDTQQSVSFGPLDKGKHFEIQADASPFLCNHFIKVESNYPVSALSYNDIGYFAPSTNGQFSGTEFYTFAGTVGNWANSLYVMAYQDGTTVTITDTTSSLPYWTGVLNKGQEKILDPTVPLQPRYYTITSDKIITVANLDPSYRHTRDHYGTYVPGKSGSGIDTVFFTPTEDDTITPTPYFGGDAILIPLPYEDNTTIHIYNATTHILLRTYRLDPGVPTDINPGYGYWQVVSDRPIALYEGYGQAMGGFVPAPRYVYVDNSNTNGSWTGTLANPYQHIQDAVINAPAWSTILVFKGIYKERITIGKPLYLTGEDTQYTILEDSSTDDVIDITSHNVTVRGFTIRNGLNGVAIQSKDDIISNNIITNNLNNGILLTSADRNNIVTNTLSYNKGNGIRVLNSQTNTISKNILTNNGANNGYGLCASGSINNRIYFNNFINNRQNAYDSSGNTWYNTPLHQGNYWSNYDEASEGAYDIDNDGIADQAYTVPPGTAIDPYPFMHPNGWTTLFVSNNKLSSWYDHYHVHTIQEGINNATDDITTVFVYSGIYHESINVNKPLRIQGENKATTIIDDQNTNSNTLVTINATTSGVTISGFTIQSITNNGNQNVGIRIKSNYNIINGNIIILNNNNGGGIQLYHTDENTISNNILMTERYGLSFVQSNMNHITSNTLTTYLSCKAVYFEQEVISRGNIFRNNAIIKQQPQDGYAFYFEIAYDLDNDIDTSNTVNGITGILVISSRQKPLSISGLHMEFPEPTIVTNYGLVNIYRCQGVSLTNCIISNHSGDSGYGIFSNGSFYNTITKNTITNNTVGILFDTSTCNTISNNVISYNHGDYGLYLYDNSGISSSSFNTISNNIISNNNHYGMFLTSSSHDNTIVKNTIQQNSGMGLYIAASGNTIYHNNFINNLGGNVYGGSSTNVWNADYPSGGNYWSDYAAKIPHPHDTNNDHIWDDPYPIDACSDYDAYPFVSQNGWNHQPIGTPDTTTVNENTQQNQIDVLANDIDVDKDPLIIIQVTSPQYGAVSTNGQFIYYTPTQNYFGTDLLTYSIVDCHGGTATASVTININRLNHNPQAIDDTTTVSYNSQQNQIDVLANDNDVDGDSLTITYVSTPQHGIASITGAFISYTPEQDYQGIDTFSYIIIDGHGGITFATVTITILAPSLVVTIISPMENQMVAASSPNNRTFLLKFTINKQVSSIIVHNDLGWGLCLVYLVNQSIKIPLDAFGANPYGAHSLTVEATDAAGNVGHATVHFTIVQFQIAYPLPYIINQINAIDNHPIKTIDDADVFLDLATDIMTQNTVLTDQAPIVKNDKVSIKINNDNEPLSTTPSQTTHDLNRLATTIGDNSNDKITIGNLVIEENTLQLIDTIPCQTPDITMTNQESTDI
jgi:parallel beta-helix repeat protein